MEAHNDVLPAIFKHPTSQQKEETSLRYKYKNYRQKTIHLTDAQHALQEEIHRRATDQKDLDILEEIVRWSAKNNHKLPARSHRRQFGLLDNKKENNLAQKLRRLRNRKYLTPILQRRLAELVDKSHNSPTKATGRGAAAIHPRRRRKTAARFVFSREKLQQLPLVLAVMVPPFAHDEDDTTICLNSEDIRTDWGDCRLDLKDHFAGHRNERVNAEYKLAAYVSYIGHDDTIPSWQFISGHFVTYFCEGNRWYVADDTVVRSINMNGAPPSAFPYLCFFQRCDHVAAMPWPPMQEAPLQADSTDDEDNDETPLNKQARTALPLASASSSSQPAMQTPQVSRKRKTCEPPSSARRAVQSTPTSKRRRLVGKQVPPEVR